MVESNEKMKVGGVFTVEQIRDGEVINKFDVHNLVVNEGLNHLLNSTLNGAAQITSWYIAPYEGNYTPVSTDTAANITANSTETTAYDEVTRVLWVPATAGSTAQSITNGSGTGAAKAVFTMNAAKTLYGVFFVSASAKSATSGTLFSALRFPAAVAVVATDVIQVTYTIQAVSS
jgi:hypothetical protein